MKDTITFALPKGRLLKPSIALLKKIGVVRPGLEPDSRKLLFKDKKNLLHIIIVRAVDVPTYVEYGAADMGIVGRDVLMEQDRDVYEPLDLRFGKCRLVLARPKKALASAQWPVAKFRVGTKYPRITEHFFSEKGIPVEIIKLSGAIELSPLIGLSERIVDLVTTGKSLRENHLVEEEVIAESTAQLIINRASLKTKIDSVMALINNLKNAVEEKSS